MKGKNQRQKVIPRCYRRNLSRTLSNSSLSQLVQLGSYKKRINDLSRNNRLLAAALQDARIEAAVQTKILQNSAKDWNKILFARLKLNEMAKNLSTFVADLEEVRTHLNVDFIPDINNLFTHKKGSPDRLCKEPTVNCINEVNEESSINDVIAIENVPSVADNLSSYKPENKTPDDVLGNSDINVGFISEDIEMAPILFADDSEVKKKKSSSRSRSSKVATGLDGSLTPELKIDVTCVKLKRNSSRRQSQFIFPGSRSTSRGKVNSSGKENSPEELVTPAEPVPLSLTHEEKGIKEVKKTVIETFQSPFNDMKGKQSEYPISIPENHPKPVFNINKCDLSVSTLNPAKHFKCAVTSEMQQSESNRTVLLCEDMELTEVIRPVYPIIVNNSSPSIAKSLDNGTLKCDISEESKENYAFDLLVKTKVNNIAEKVTSEKNSLELFNLQPNTSKLHNDDIQLPEINEHDEVQNVGMITFCEPNDDNKNISRTNKSSLIRPSRQTQPVKYAVFFSSDESNEDSPIKIITKKEKSNKHKSVISKKIYNSCEKTESTVNHRIVSLENGTEMIENNILKCTMDDLNSKKEKKPHKKSIKKSKDATSSKKDMHKQSPKCLTSSKGEKCNLKKKENALKLIFSPLFSPGGILKKTQSDYQLTEEIKNKTPLKKIAYNDNFDDSVQNVVETPKSESRKVSFAPTDLVCNFKRMSVSKKIADNKKLRRTSKSVLDFEELLKEEIQAKNSGSGTDNSSENTNIEKLNEPVLFDFSGETELYTLVFPRSSPFVPAVDDLLFKSTAASNAAKKNVNKPNIHSKNLSASKPVKSSEKLSLKKIRDPISTQPLHTTDDLFKETDVLLFESPVSVCKPVKRKSLFKEHLDDNSKENINFDPEVPEKPENVLHEKNKIHIKKKSTTLKRQSKVQGKVSTKKLSDRTKLPEPTPEMKKKISMAVKCFENSPVLRDSGNLPDMQDMTSRRRSKPVSYREPSLIKKLRRE